MIPFRRAFALGAAVVLAAACGTTAAPAATSAAPVAAATTAAPAPTTAAPAPTTAAPVATTAAPAAGSAVAIDILAFKFPVNTDVAKGTKVTWTNKDAAKHTVTSGTRPVKEGAFDGQLDGGAVFSFTFTTAGTFPYFCSLHSSMNATITVK